VEKLTTWIENPKTRRQLLTITSGSMIIAALVSGYLFEAHRLQVVLMIISALVAGSDIALRAVRSLSNRHISIELLVTVAAGGALIIGEYWEAAAVTFLFVFGAYLEARTLSRTRQVLGDLLELAPATAIVFREGRQVEIPSYEVQLEEIVIVKPGAKIPVDGDVIAGNSHVDESAITGEPMPAEKARGSDVFAGTINQNGLLRVRAIEIGSDTTLARIIRRVEEAQEEKAPTQRFIERFSRWYTPAIIALSLITFSITRDIELALTLLVIGCPGALVISTPISIVAGIGRAAKSGILIKGGEHLENAGKISALSLDKTGTLTQGKPRVTNIVSFQTEIVFAGLDIGNSLAMPNITHNHLDYSSWGGDQLSVLHWASIAESGSEHPLARAIVQEYSDQESVLGENFSFLQADKFTAHPGKGVQASYMSHVIAVGTEELMAQLDIDLPPDAEYHLNKLKSTGKTAVLVSLDESLLGIIGISDPIRISSQDMVAELRQTGIRKIAMLTGDDNLTAQSIAAEAGIDEVYADLLPDDKLQIIRQFQSEGYVVAMSGDGINDAPALAAADIGIAMGAAGTDIAIETADIALMADDLMKIPEAIRISKATLRNIRQNVVIALVTVALLLLGVFAKEVNMAGGMLVHELSVLIVILNGMRLLNLRI
jgi:Cd2+/Zn2+-exporting ATPase